MADRSEIVLKGKDGVYFREEFGEVTVSNGDTVTLDQFSATTNLANVYIMKKSDGTEMTQTHAANNVITITGAGANLPCVYLAYGVKA
jgi:hypothetical protein